MVHLFNRLVVTAGGASLPEAPAFLRSDVQQPHLAAQQGQQQQPDDGLQSRLSSHLGKCTCRLAVACDAYVVQHTLATPVWLCSSQSCCACYVRQHQARHCCCKQIAGSLSKLTVCTVSSRWRCLAHSLPDQHSQGSGSVIRQCPGFILTHLM